MASDPGTPLSLRLDLPAWVRRWLAEQAGPGVAPRGATEARVRLVLDLAAQNVRHRSGGPFAAAVFGERSGDLVAVGVNVVVPLHCSSAHAEVLALSLAQARLGTHDLAAVDEPLQLVASSEMCAMCLGATVWSGVASVVWSATSDDVESIAGFDEGPRHPLAHDELRDRGIRVLPGVLRDEGRRVLATYAELGGPVYNSRRRIPRP